MNNMDNKLQNIRTDFTKNGLWITDLLKNPLQQLEKWLDEAVVSKLSEPTAMNLSTIDSLGKPHSRIVLLKGLEDGLIFYTNYNSKKGEQMTAVPFVSTLFFWPQLERQIQVNGKVEKLKETDSDTYFASRPRESQLGAWASPQSQPLDSYDLIERNYLEYVERFQGKEVSRPPHWGGYRIIPETYEFWQGRPGRLHQRYKYVKNLNKWEILILAP
ncbi:MAG TPA: pyridoxamine 5'-phosphate oxidase [Marinilabiliaceae bacterium]|nr:pyridoxamine 5'-phosphate oxidase [Marinilabiliaceae bacterium]